MAYTMDTFAHDLAETMLLHEDLIESTVLDPDDVLPALTALAHRLNKMSKSTLGGIVLATVIKEKLRCEHGKVLAEPCEVCG